MQYLDYQGLNELDPRPVGIMVLYKTSGLWFDPQDFPMLC